MIFFWLAFQFLSSNVNLKIVGWLCRTYCLIFLCVYWYSSILIFLHRFVLLTPKEIWLPGFWVEPGDSWTADFLGLKKSCHGPERRKWNYSALVRGTWPQLGRIRGSCVRRLQNNGEAGNHPQACQQVSGYMNWGLTNRTASHRSHGVAVPVQWPHAE